MTASVVGIDVSKDRLDVFMDNNGQEREAAYDNAKHGFYKLHQWLRKHQAKDAHICLEATGTYGDDVALYLHGRGYRVSVVNPARIKAYADSRLQRNKTDALDARLIAAFCRSEQPRVWTPPPPHRLEMRAMTRRLEDLKRNLTQERNRLASGVKTLAVETSLRQHIAYLEQQIDDLLSHIKAFVCEHDDLRDDDALLQSIKGIGDITSFMLLGELLNLDDLNNTKELIAFAGLNPRHTTSGKRRSRRTPISKRGSSRLRACLYMAAMAAIRSNPAVKALAKRLEAAGLTGQEIITAAMAKLLRIAFGVLKNRRPFDATICLPRALAA